MRDSTAPVRSQVIEGPSGSRVKGTSENVGGYQPEILWPALGIFVLVTAGLAILPAAAKLTVYAALALWALRGVRSAVEALTILWLITSLNEGLVVPLENQTLVRWLVVVTALGRMIFGVNLRRFLSTGFTISLLAFSMTSAALAVLVSYAPVVSLLKLVVFTLGVIAVVAAFHATRALGPYWASWFYSLFVFVIFASLPLYFHDLGFFRFGRQHGLFQGVLTHPQSLGVFLAPPLAWLIWLFLNGRVKRWHQGAAIIAGLMMVFFSGARISLVAIVLSIGLLVVIAALRLAVSNHAALGAVRYGRLAFLCFAGASLLIAATMLAGQITTFISKGRDFQGIVSGYEQSRGFMLEASFENFLRHPIGGIGFGVASEVDRVQASDGGRLDIPLGAPTEKGFLPTALLEEVGVIGSTMFLLFAAALVRKVWRTRNRAACALFLGCLFVNIGEMVFFSFGAMGLYMWLLIGVATVSDPTRPEAVLAAKV